MTGFSDFSLYLSGFWSQHLSAWENHAHLRAKPSPSLAWRDIAGECPVALWPQTHITAKVIHG